VGDIVPPKVNEPQGLGAPMRGPAVVAALLVFALAGCASSSPGSGAEDGGSGRTGRGGGQAEAEELRPIVVLEAPLRMAGQGPESLAVDVPPQTRKVIFRFEDSATFEFVGLRVGLSGCGAHHAGALTITGGVMAGPYENTLCGPAEAGAQTATVSGDFVLFDGTFVLMALVAAGNATAGAGGAGSGA
jgi:hypothetical protein